MFTQRKIIYVAVILVIIGGVYLWSGYYIATKPQEGVNNQGGSENNNIKNVVGSDAVIFEKRANWGPCPNPEGGCFENVTLYASGKLEEETGKGVRRTNISVYGMDYFKDTIHTKNLLYRECPFDPVVDFWATYKIALDGVTREITFPGCEKELRDIDAWLGDVIEQENQ